MPMGGHMNPKLTDGKNSEKVDSLGFRVIDPSNINTDTNVSLTNQSTA